MNWEFISHFIIPPLVGAVIGYFTNLIAVKMLFFPHEEKKIFGHTVPFTPGAIPKGKKRLAKAAGEIVSKELFTMEDISNKMLTEEIEKPLIDKAMGILDTNIKETGSILVGSEEKYDMLEKSFTDLLALKITEAIKNMDIPRIIQIEGARMANESLSTSKVLSLLISYRMVDRLMITVGEKMEEFLDEKGPGMVAEVCESRIHDLGERTPLHVLDQAGYDREFVRKKLTEAYRHSVYNAVTEALDRINVAGIVEDKINAMSVDELEKGVLTVMKNELDMIVNLGALIGLVIGCINIFV